MVKAALILTIVLLVTPAFAETILLKSGKSIEGKIIEDSSDYIKLETQDGLKLYYDKNTISGIKGSNEWSSPKDSTGPVLATGLLDYTTKGYMLYVPKKISSAAILICLPGLTVKARQDIDNWAFSAGKRGFLVLGLDVDYGNINFYQGVDILYSRIYNIVNSLASQYPIKKDRLYLVGTSAGGMMSVALALRYPERFKAIGVVSGGRLTLPAQQSLSNARGLAVYMVHGQEDTSIPIGEFQVTRKLLGKNGAVIEYKVVPRGRHTLSTVYYTEVVDWISQLNDLSS